MSFFWGGGRSGGSLQSRQVAGAWVWGIHNWLMLHHVHSLRGSASCPDTVWWTTIFSPAASSRQSPHVRPLLALQLLNGQRLRLPSWSILSFIVVSSLKSSWYWLGFFIGMHLRSVSCPTPLGGPIMQRAWKWDAQEVPQLGSTGTERYCRS